MTARTIAVVGALALALGACQPDDPGPAASPEASPAASPESPSASPVRGGSVTFGVYGEPATLDPHSPLASDLTYALATPLYRSLYRLEPGGDPVPDLVASLEPSGDTATIRLVNARWSDGSQVTARDVVATIGRARQPSGLAEIDSVRPTGRRSLVVTGAVEDWPQTLARASYILPSNRRRVFSGPFVLRSRVPGLQVTLEANPTAEPRPLLDRITVQFTEGLDILVALLERGDLDAAWVPSSLNLVQRLDELGLAHIETLGWERVILDLEGSDLSLARKKALAGAVKRRAIETGFVREAGRISDTLVPEPGPGGSTGAFDEAFRSKGRGEGTTIQLGAPSGDELLELIQRLVQVQLDKAGFDVELINVEYRRYYGAWSLEDPIDVAIRRAAGAPGLAAMASARSLRRLPLFHVATLVATQDGLEGVEVSPTIEGPLWNAQEWYLVDGGGT